MIIYMCIIVVVELILHLVCFPFFIYPGLQFLKTVTTVSLAIFAFTAFLTWYIGPGYIIREPEITQAELLQRFKVSELCFECRVIALPRSYHCNVCKQCVERFDHHCPWVNSCIGTKNHGFFLAFITFQAIYIISILIQIFGFCLKSGRAYDVNGKLISTCQSPDNSHFSDWCTDSLTNSEHGFFAGSQNSHSNLLVFFFMTLLLLMACLFTFGLLSLLLMQVKNFFTGMTTMERLGAPGHRNRKFTFVDEIEEFAQMSAMEEMTFDDQERHLPPLSTADSDGYTRVPSTQDQHV